MLHKQTLAAGCFLLALVITGGALMGGNGALALAPTPTATPLSDPVLADFDPASVADIDLADYPIIPETISDQALSIYQGGLALGNDPETFAKVGDCMTDNEFFLIPIGDGDVDLGDYADLQAVIDQFSAGENNSFARVSQAAAGGFNTSSILDTMWANPQFCEAGETPLSCEFRAMKPSIALIMFGTNDVYYLDEGQFDYFLRSIIVATIRNGTLPVLSTFPIRPEFPEKSALYNQIVVKVASDYTIPLINLWAALDPLPDHGVDAVDTTHMSEPPDGHAAYFNEANLQTGFTVRNLTVLETLQTVLDAARQRRSRGAAYWSENGVVRFLRPRLKSGSKERSL